MRARNVVTSCGVACVLLIGPLAGAALAHVEVSSPTAAQGGSAELTFEVPSEKDVPTIAVEVSLPIDTPILDITVPPIDGWELSLVRAAPVGPVTGPDGQPVAEVVSSVTWTAIGTGIEPDGVAAFVLDAGVLPAVDQIAFPARQTYSDGSVVSWIEEYVDGAEPEPDFPAPVLFLAPSTAPPPATGLSVSTSELLGSGTGDPAVVPEGESSKSTFIAVVAVLAVGLLGGAGYAIARRRRRT